MSNCPSIVFRLVETKKQREKNEKRNKCGRNISVEMTYGGDMCDQLNLRLIYGSKVFGFYGTSLLNFLTPSSFPTLELHHCLKVMRALSKSTTKSSDHLNLVFESVPAAATCSLVLLAILQSIALFPIHILLFCCCFLLIYLYASSSIDQAEWLHETNYFSQQNWIAFSKLSHHSKTSQLAFSLPHLIVKQFQQSLLLIGVLVLK